MVHLLMWVAIFADNKIKVLLSLWSSFRSSILVCCVHDDVAQNSVYAMGTGVGADLRGSVVIKVKQNRWGCKHSDQLGESCSLWCTPGEKHILLKKLGKRLGDSSKVVNKSVKIQVEANETANIMDRLQYVEIRNSLNFIGVRSDTWSIRKVAKGSNLEPLKDIATGLKK